jgi:hypothetical protein
MRQGEASGQGHLAARVNDVLLAPFVVAANAGVAALHATLAVAAVATDLAARAVEASRLPPVAAAAGACKSAAAAVLDESLTGLYRATANARDAVAGDGERSANQRLAGALLDDALGAASLPWSAAWEAATEQEEVRQAAFWAFRLLSGALDPWSRGGVLPDPTAQELSARTRLALAQALIGGPFSAVLRDWKGMAGGLAALMLGDPSRLAKGARDFRGSMEYVYEKKLHGQCQPQSDFPFREQLAEHATQIVERFPYPFVEALDRGHPGEIAGAFWRHLGDVNTLILRYPLATYHVLAGSSTFVFLGNFLDVGAAYRYALCELAIMESRLASADKDWAHDELLRKTAPKTIVSNEYYIPLIIPCAGEVREKAYRRNAAGEIINDHTTTPSVFPRSAIELGQAIHSELTSLPALLWLYGDEPVAREKNLRETTRKFGPGPARRIAEQPLFPLRSEQIAQLTRSGPRTREEIDRTLDRLLREHGVPVLAEGVRRGAFLPGELL